MVSILLVILTGACDRATEQSSETKIPPNATVDKALPSAPASPIDTVRACHALRNAGQFRQAAEMVVPERRDAVLDLLLSVDRLTIANRELERAVRERIGAATATVFSRPGVANIVGVFSRDVEVVSERVESDRAEVTIQVASRLPLERVTLVRRGGDWLIARPDGALELDVRATVRTDDGDLIYTYFRGIIHAAPEVIDTSPSRSMSPLSKKSIAPTV